MKQITLSLSILASIAFISCNPTQSGPQSSQTQGNDSVTTENFKSLYASVSASEISGNKIPKYNYEVLAGPNNKDAIKIKTLSTDIPIGPQSNIPTTLKDLPNGGYSYYKFDQDHSADASVMGFTGSIGKKEMVIIKEFCKYVKIKEDGVEKKYGIGIRCFVHVKSFKTKIGYSNLPTIAANVQLNNAEAEYSFAWLGLGVEGDMIVGDKPVQGTLNVDNFANVEIIFDNIIKQIKTNGNIAVTPVLLPEAPTTPTNP